MAPVALQIEDHARDAAFKKAMHGNSAQKSAFMAMISKDSKSQEVAADAYFKHWDNKDAKIETEEDRETRKADYANLTRK
jgi:sterol 24-C-methyltransferase